MPKRLASIGAIAIWLIAIGQAARIHRGPDIAIERFHVPMVLSRAVSAVAALLCVMQFREANV